MQLYSRDEITAMNQKIAETTKSVQELIKDIATLNTELKTEDSEENKTNLEKTIMNKTLDKEAKTLEVQHLKKKISATNK